MNRFLVMVLAGLLGAAGCGPKKDAQPATKTAEKSDAASSGLSKFQKKLVDTTVSNWEPTSNSGAQFIYTSLNFAADGTWKAEGVVKADFEEFPCAEAGTWSVTSEDSASAGTVEWKLGKTDCISREPGTELRTFFEFSGGDYKISFR